MSLKKTIDLLGITDSSSFYAKLTTALIISGIAMYCMSWKSEIDEEITTMNTMNTMNTTIATTPGLH